MRMAPCLGSKAFTGRNGQSYLIESTEVEMPPENVGLAFANGWTQLPIIPDKVPPSNLELAQRISALEGKMKAEAAALGA